MWWGLWLLIKKRKTKHINLHRIWVERVSSTSPTFLRKKTRIPKFVFPPYILWLLSSPHFPPALFAGASPYLWALQTPALLMNKHCSVCGAPYTLETMFSFKVLRIAWSCFVNISGTSLLGWGERQWSISYIIKHKELCLQLYKQHRKWIFSSCYFLSIKIMQTGQIQQLLCEASEMSNHSFPK